MQRIKIPPDLAELVNANSPEILSLGGVQAVPTHVVDKLPFWFTGKKIHGQVWDGEIYLKREWLARYAKDLSTLPLHPDVVRLWLHEWGHVWSQRQFWGPFWCWGIFYYIWKRGKEESSASAFRDAIWARAEREFLGLSDSEIGG